MDKNSMYEFDDYTRELLENETNLEAFVDYYNNRKQKTFDYLKHNCKGDKLEEKTLSINTMKKLIIDLFVDKSIIGLPEKITLNKMKSKKNRVVYVYGAQGTLILKYINYLLGDIVVIHPRCYSFQRGKNLKESIRYLRHADVEGLSCIKVDITNYFNSIPIEGDNHWFLDELKEVPGIGSLLLDLLKEERVVVRRESDRKVQMEKSKGVMAGMPLSPLLSNLYLKDFDEEMSSLFHTYARYSDDMVFFCLEDEVEEKLAFIKSRISDKGLSLNKEKTRVFKPQEGFEFLGLSIIGKTVDLSPITIDKMKKKIKRATRSVYRWQVKKDVDYEKSVMVMVRKFNRKFYGIGASETDFTWAKWFFGLINQTSGLAIIDEYYQETIRYLGTGSYKKINYKLIPYKMLQDKGYIPLVSAYYKEF